MTVSRTAKDGGTYQFRFSYQDGTGRVHVRQQGFRTKAEAQRAEVSARSKVNGGSGYRLGTGTVGDYLGHWLDRYKSAGKVKPSTLWNADVHVNRYLVPRIGDLQLRKLTSTVIAKLYADLLTDGIIKPTATRKGLSPKTVRNIGGTLHKALSDGVKWNILSTNPADAADLPRWDRPDPDGWNVDEVGQFLNHVAKADPFHYALFRLMLLASLRRGEVLGLRWQDVDLVFNRVSVVQTRTAVNGRVIVGTPKSRRSRRTVRIDAETGVALARLKEAQEQSAQAAGSWPSDLVATDLTGKPCHPLTFTRTFQRYIEAAGVRRITLHKSRDTAVFVGLGAGVDIATVSGRLGHDDPGFTLAHYAPYLQSADDGAAFAIGAAFDRGIRIARSDADRRANDAELDETTETSAFNDDTKQRKIGLNVNKVWETVEATPGIEPGYRALQALA